MSAPDQAAPQLTHRLRYSDRPLGPLASLATVAGVFLALAAVLYVPLTAVEIEHAISLNRLLEGETSRDAVEDIELRIGVLSFLVGLCNLLAAGFFIPWMYRAYRNLERSSVAALRYEPGWAIGAWFIPVFNYIRPKQMINDIWRAGVVGAEVRDDSWHRRPVAPLVHWWWAAWVLTAVIGIAAAVVGFDLHRALESSDEIADARNAAMISAVAYVCSAVAAILACLVLRRMTRRSDELREAVHAAAWAAWEAHYGSQAEPGPVARPRLAERSDQAPSQPLPAPPRPASAPPPPGESAQLPLIQADGDRWRCGICGWAFGDPADVRSHLVTHHRRSD